MIEVHSDPEHASSDGPQSLKPAKFALLMEKLKLFATVAEETPVTSGPLSPALPPGDGRREPQLPLPY